MNAKNIAAIVAVVAVIGVIAAGTILLGSNDTDDSKSNYALLDDFQSNIKVGLCLDNSYKYTQGDTWESLTKNVKVTEVQGNEVRADVILKSESSYNEDNVDDLVDTFKYTYFDFTDSHDYPEGVTYKDPVSVGSDKKYTLNGEYVGALSNHTLKLTDVVIVVGSDGVGKSINGTVTDTFTVLEKTYTESDVFFTDSSKVCKTQTYSELNTKANFEKKYVPSTFDPTDLPGATITESKKTYGQVECTVYHATLSGDNGYSGDVYTYKDITLKTSLSGKQAGKNATSDSSFEIYMSE